MTRELVKYSCDGTVAHIELDRVEKRNALSEALMDQLADAAERAQREARVAVISGRGDHFSAGIDLAEVATWVGDAEQRQSHRRGGRALRRFDEIARSSIPFVAAISGACVGGGLEIAASCHIRVADSTAFFALPEGQRGIFLGGGGSVRITRLLGVHIVTDMMLTGRVMSAAQAEACGLVNYGVEAGESRGKAKELAARIAQNSEAVNWAVVTCIPRIAEVPYDEGLFTESLVLDAVMSRAADSMALLHDFINKRARPLDRPQTERGTA
jgi:(methylthio)acryloyl-CoA hydratase